MSLWSMAAVGVMTDCRFDTPLKLYDNPDGLFFSLCERSGISREDIVKAAKQE